MEDLKNRLRQIIEQLNKSYYMECKLGLLFTDPEVELTKNNIGWKVFPNILTIIDFLNGFVEGITFARDYYR